MRRHNASMPLMTKDVAKLKTIFKIFSLSFPFISTLKPAPAYFLYILQLGSVGLCDSHCLDMFPSLVTPTQGTHSDSMGECCQWADIAKGTHTQLQHAQ